MPGLLIMLPIAILLALGFLIFFFWSLRNGDIADAELSSMRLLLEDDAEADRSIVATKQTRPESASPERGVEAQPPAAGAALGSGRG